MSRAPTGSPPPPPLAEFETLGRFAPPRVHDGFSQTNLRRRLAEYTLRSVSPAAHVVLRLDGAEQPSWVPLFLGARPPRKIGLGFHRHTGSPETWEFVPPPSALAFTPGGSGVIMTLDFDPTSLDPWRHADRGVQETCLVRISLRECYVPRSIRQEQGARSETLPTAAPGELFTPGEFVEFVRTTGIVPFQVALLAYTSETRYRYEIDLVHNVLLKDPRAGKMPLSSFEPRPVRLLHGLDRTVARGDLPLLPRRILETLFESQGLNVVEAATIFGVSPDLAEGSLRTLVARGYATWDPGGETYRVLPFAVLSEEEARQQMAEEVHAGGPETQAPERGSPPAPAPDEGPPLATPSPPAAPSPLRPEGEEGGAPGPVGTGEPPASNCPLCGGLLPDPDSLRLICPSCERKVGTPAEGGRESPEDP